MIGKEALDCVEYLKIHWFLFAVILFSDSDGEHH